MGRCLLTWDDGVLEAIIEPGQEGISEVRLLHVRSRVDASFDERKNAKPITPKSHGGSGFRAEQDLDDLAGDSFGAGAGGDHPHLRAGDGAEAHDGEDAAGVGSPVAGVELDDGRRVAGCGLGDLPGGAGV
jgi:hypothetical protein